MAQTPDGAERLKALEERIERSLAEELEGHDARVAPGLKGLEGDPIPNDDIDKWHEGEPPPDRWYEAEAPDTTIPGGDQDMGGNDHGAGPKGMDLDVVREPVMPLSDRSLTGRHVSKPSLSDRGENHRW